MKKWKINELKIKKKIIKIYPSLIVALGFSFSFSFFFFLQVKKAAMVYVAILFFSGEKKNKKKTQISLP